MRRDIIRPVYLLWFLLTAGLLLFVPARAEHYFFEAESMKCDGTNWKAIDHFGGGWYGGSPSRGKMLKGSEGGQGTAIKSIFVKAAGAYHLWVRYLDVGRFRGPFTVTVRQDGADIASARYDMQSLRDSDEGMKKWGRDYGNFVWVALPVQLHAGLTEIAATKAEPIGVTWITRYLDCFVLTDDLRYEPKVEDFQEPLYIKVKMGPTQKEACVIHFFGRRPRGVPTYWVPDSNIYKDRVWVGGCNTGYDPKGKNETLLTAGSESPWFNLAPLLDAVGYNAVKFYAMQQYNVMLPAADFTLLFSHTPSEAGIFTRFTRTGPGAGMIVRIDMNKLDELKSDREWSRLDVGAARQVPVGPGKRPARYPIYTGCALEPGLLLPETVDNEALAMKVLGVNGTNWYDPAFAKSGIKWITGGAGSYFYWTNGCMSDRKEPQATQSIKAEVKAILDGKHADQIVAWNQMDEPGSHPLAHIAACPKCTAGFRVYLQKLGLQPAAFGKATWDEIAPVKDAMAGPELYYYSVDFRCRLLADYFKFGTDQLHQDAPTARVTANFAEALTFNGNGLAEGVDWFMILGENALTYGWTENWLSFSTSYQLCGYQADFMRSAARGKPFGFYNILYSPWDSAVKTAALVGHGVKCIYHYNYGPEWTLTSDAHSSNYALMPALHRADYAIGAVEDSLVTARVPASKIGLLYPRTTDVWTLNQEHSTFGKERMGLYLLLRHLGYPTDVYTESDVIEGKLGGCRFLVLSGSHLRRDTAQALIAWVKAGGHLCLGPGGMTRDEFDRPLELDGALGIARGAYAEKQNAGREIYEGPGLKSLEAVDFHGAALESLCGIQKLAGAVPADARVLATFADGSPAALVKPMGKGQVIFCGTFPGLGYLKSGVLAMQERDRQLKAAGKPQVTYNPPSYDRNYQSLLAAMLQDLNWAPPVTTSNYLVEADLLEHDNGLVIALSNWTGAPIASLSVSLPVNGPYGKPFAALGGINSWSRKDGRLMLSVRLDEVEYIVVPKGR